MSDGLPEGDWDWTCLAGPPPGRGEFLLLAAFAVVGLIVWYFS